MRTIDADKAIEEFCGYCTLDPKKCGGDCSFMRFIERQPTVDPVNNGVCLRTDNNGPRPCEPINKFFYHFVDGDETLTVHYTIDGIIEGLRFKAEHIKARVEPEFFEAAAHRLAEISSSFEHLQRSMQ